MGRIAVTSDELTAAAARLGSVGRELQAVQTALGRVEAAGHAADNAAMEVALAGLAQVWTAAVTSFIQSTDALSGTTSAAGQAYNATDANAFGLFGLPGVGGGSR